MNTDDLRDALSRDAQDQPPPSETFASGVERRIHRQRQTVALVAAPFVVAVVLVAALLGTRGGRDATIATADSSTGTAVPTSVTGTAAPSTTAMRPTSTTPTTVAPTEVPAPPASDAPGGPDTTASTTTTVTGGACGTVTLAADPNASFDTAPFTCFLRALKAGVPADLVVRVNGPQGGSFTDHLSTGADHLLTVSVDGSMTVTLPAFSLGSGGGPASGPAAGTAGGDCGTVSITPTPNGGTDMTKQLDQTAVRCLVAAFMSGSPATLDLVINGAQGGAITTHIELRGDHTVALTSSGTMRVQLPANVAVPEDLLNAIPPGNMTLGQLPGMSGLGKRCATHTTATSCTKPTR